MSSMRRVEQEELHGLAMRMKLEAPAAAAKARGRKSRSEWPGAELKCCAPLDPLPLLTARPGSARSQ